MGRYGHLDRLLDFMEENIDLNHIAQIEQLQYDAIKYRKVDRIPLTILTEHDGFEQAPYEESFYDPEKMLYNELLRSTVHSCYNSVRLKDDGPLMIRSNHGAGIIASLFGCKTHVAAGRMPCVQQISVEEARKRFLKGVPDLYQALAKQVVDTCSYYRGRLKQYPKCSKAIRITQPDLQGPYDTLHFILGNEAFILPFNEPDTAKQMVDIIAQTYVALRRYIAPCLTDEINKDAVFVNGVCAAGKVLIKADAGVANLSPEYYQIYEGEPDRSIMEAFQDEGGGSISYYGGPKNWYNNRIYNEHLGCLHFGNPEMHDLKTEYSFFKARKVAIVGWGYNQDYQFIKKALLTGDSGAPVKTGMTFICEAIDIEHGKEILARYKDLCYQCKTDRFI